jgi:hypothetical protein
MLLIVETDTDCGSVVLLLTVDAGLAPGTTSPPAAAVAVTPV